MNRLDFDVGLFLFGKTPEVIGAFSESNVTMALNLDVVCHSRSEIEF